MLVAGQGAFHKLDAQLEEARALLVVLHSVGLAEHAGVALDRSPGEVVVRIGKLQLRPVHRRLDDLVGKETVLVDELEQILVAKGIGDVCKTIFKDIIVLYKNNNLWFIVISKIFGQIQITFHFEWINKIYC